jgi:hypothetical protein
MFIVYLRQRDYRLSAIALLVLTIILLGFALGLAGSKHHDTGASPMQTTSSGHGFNRAITAPCQSREARTREGSECVGVE